MKPMTGKEAIELIAKECNVKSLYAFAQLLSNREYVVQPTQISNWRKGKKMSKRAAKQFADLFDITIHEDSVYSKGVFTK